MARIDSIALYEVRGVRSSIVAPNAYAGIRPAEAHENLLVLETDSGLQGVTNWAIKPSSQSDAERDIGWLVGLDPMELFEWDGGQVIGRCDKYSKLLKSIAPVDIALLDLCAQKKDVSLWQILGHAVRERVPVYDATVYFEDLVDETSGIESVVDKAMLAVDRGHRAIKIKVGRGLRWMAWPESTERDIQVCRAVREAVGRDVKLMIDGNQGYAGYVNDAIDLLTEVSNCRLEFVEELVSWEEVAELKAAMSARGITVPVAGGEDALSADWCERVLPRCPLDILQMDPCLIGIVDYLAISRFADSNGIQIAPHNYGSSVGLLASVHLGKVCKPLLYAESDDCHFEDYELSGLMIQDGQAALNGTVGLGVSLQEAAIAKVGALE